MSVVGAFCAREQQTAFCSELGRGHICSFDPLLKQIPLTPSPPHPNAAKEWQQLFISGAFSHTDWFWISWTPLQESVCETRSGVILYSLSVRPFMTSSFLFVPLMVMVSNLLDRCLSPPPPVKRACYQSSVFSPPGRAWIQLYERVVWGRTQRDQTWYLSLELGFLSQPVWCVINCLSGLTTFYMVVTVYLKTWWKNVYEYCKGSTNVTLFSSVDR